MKLIIGITGASGIAYASELIKLLCNRSETQHIEPYVIISNSAFVTAKYENVDLDAIQKLVNFCYDEVTIEASLASGSFVTAGMIIVPCSMKTLSNVACGNSGNLITRAADVCLKERRKLILAVRETPYTAIHIQNMATVTNAGGIIAPLSPGLYHGPGTIQDVLRYMSARLLDLIDVHVDINRWKN